MDLADLALIPLETFKVATAGYRTVHRDWTIHYTEYFVVLLVLLGIVGDVVIANDQTHLHLHQSLAAIQTMGERARSKQGARPREEEERVKKTKIKLFIIQTRFQ